MNDARIMRTIVVGGGILGTTHAWQALKLGHDVIHVERDLLPRGASVRNFGLIWVSGRRAGLELNEAIRARLMWEELSLEFPAMEFNPNGSLTLAKNEMEVAILEECLTKVDANVRQWSVLDKRETQRVNPALRGAYLAALWCPLDATVEPATVLTSLRAGLSKKPKYRWRSGVEIKSITPKAQYVQAISDSDEIFEGDLLILCPGADHQTLFKDEFAAAPIRQVRLQMMSTDVFPEKLTTSIADGDSLRYYPAYAETNLATLPIQAPIASEKHMQLLLVQRSDGTLTIGDTHEYETPFEFTLDERPYEYLHEVASSLIGKTLPPIVRRWDGIYSQRIDGEIVDRRFIFPNVITVTGPGGRGNSLAPAIAEQTFDLIQRGSGDGI